MISLWIGCVIFSLTHSLRLHDFFGGGCVNFCVERLHDFFVERLHDFFVERLHDFLLRGV